MGLHFRRQEPIEGYIADFYCDALRLVVEVDGSVHDDEHQMARDRIRDTLMREDRYLVCRFSNGQIRDDLDGVVAQLRMVVAQRRQALHRPRR